jgi:transcriptional regulator with XRE-family HTH domain
MTQAELAGHLGMSQSRLSQVERGGGSFTAEQLIVMLRLFNVAIERFDPVTRVDGSLQNALVEFGAHHLRVVPEVGIRSEHQSPERVVRAVLLHPDERFVTALAPVLLWRMDVISLPVLQREFVSAGVPGRLPWLVEHTLGAWREEPTAPPEWRRRGQRAGLLMNLFLERIPPVEPSVALDILDAGIRSQATLESAWDGADDVAGRWRVVTRIVRDDFIRSLNAAIAEDW